MQSNLKLTPEERFNNILIDINTELSSVTDPIRDEIDKYHTDEVTKDKYQVCGNVENQPNYTKEDIAAGSSEIEKIVNEINSNPEKFPDLKHLNKDYNPPGYGSGNSTTLIPMTAPIYPEWLKELNEAAKTFMKWGKTKQWYDEESLTRGVPRRHKVKKNVKEKSIYIWLDVSGSMWGYEYRGVPLVQLMVQYFPDLAKRYTGELWQIDTHVNKIVPLKELTKSKMKNLMIVGRGGTDFNEAFRMIVDKKKMLEAKGESPDFMTIIFTDGEVEWPRDDSPLMIDNLVIVVPKDKARYVPSPNKDKQRKVIMIESD